MEISQKEVKRLLDYDPETGIFTWKERVVPPGKAARTTKAWNTLRAGTTAGCLCPRSNGYEGIKIRINDVLYQAHQIAWLYMTGEYLGTQIDHINRIATDNRWSNLRDGAECNYKNKTTATNNSSGFNGVSRMANGRFRAYYTVDRRQIHLGCFGDAEEAAKVAKKARDESGCFSGHGSKREDNG